MEQDRAAIDALVARFFAVFDNRGGRTPTTREFEVLFVPAAVIATHTGGATQLSSPTAFVEPRIALLTSGALVDFHEWETESRTEILGTLGTRRSRYSKHGYLDGSPYQGNGTKYFHFAKLNQEWRIVSLSWIDDPAPVAGGSD